MSMTEEQIDLFVGYSDEQFRQLAQRLQNNQKPTASQATKVFLALPTETVAASIKWAVFLLRPLPL
jgi:hypothetical protein